MTFVIKREHVEPHHCNTPPQTQNKPLVPGDVWKCDDCARYWIWASTYEYINWLPISERQARKELRRYGKGKPFKQRSGEDTGPG